MSRASPTSGRRRNSSEHSRRSAQTVGCSIRTAPGRSDRRHSGECEARAATGSQQIRVAPGRRDLLLSASRQLDGASTVPAPRGTRACCGRSHSSSGVAVGRRLLRRHCDRPRSGVRARAGSASRRDCAPTLHKQMADLARLGLSPPIGDRREPGADPCARIWAKAQAGRHPIAPRNGRVLSRKALVGAVTRLPSEPVLDADASYPLISSVRRTRAWPRKQ